MRGASFLFAAAAPLALIGPAYASTGPEAASVAVAHPAESAEAKPVAEGGDVVTTGVARGRDRLDSATSTSSLKAAEIAKLAPRSVGDILRDIPGVRSEASSGEGNANISIRGLPIASTGGKFVQLQEDGLPVLEFGDILGNSPDVFLRADLNLQQVEVIRGGSASTFASNSPGGIIAFQSKTGDVEGGAIQVGAGLDYDEYRADFDYGAKISDTLRFHVGGFFRQGEGPRRTGYDALKGGQIKANVTKEFGDGYIRFYGKYLNDRVPTYDMIPVGVTGTNDDPRYRSLTNFDVRHDTLLSRYITTSPTLNSDNTLVAHDVRSGLHATAKTFGFETQVPLAGWTVIEKFRFSDMAATNRNVSYLSPVPAAAVAARLGGPGATLAYATGPDAGQRIADPAALNGNGLAGVAFLVDNNAPSLDNVVNDLRVSRVWPLAAGELTTTAGFYASRQTIDLDVMWNSIVTDLAGGGKAHLIDVVTGAGRPVTQNGFLTYDLSLLGALGRRSHRLQSTVNAPFGSFNYHRGRLAIGGSLRYDYGGTTGQLVGAELGGGRIGVAPRDINGDGRITGPEAAVGVFPNTRPAPVDFSYHYLSYSTGINFRIAEPFAAFARYSRGGRANAERLVFSPLVNTATGALTLKGAAVDVVTQAEGGVKYRQGGLTLNLTGFWAKAEDTNFDTRNGEAIQRLYKAKGLEFEGAYRTGPFSVTAGATFTDANIDRDDLHPELVGNTPRHQAKLIYQLTPQYATERFSIGAVFIGTTDSYGTDENQLKAPGYTTTNGFIQVRPAANLLLSLNANNLFDVKAFIAIDDATIPASGIVRVHPLNGRTISAAARFDF